MAPHAADPAPRATRGAAPASLTWADRSGTAPATTLTTMDRTEAV